MFWPPKNITTLLHIQHPIIQAPMAGSTNAELVAAVSNAGGLGSHGAAPQSLDALRKTIKEIKALTSKPFNINLFHHSTEGFDESIQISDRHHQQLSQYHHEQGLGEIPLARGLFGPARDQLKLLVDENVPVISFHFGVDADTIAYAKSGGAIVLCSATTAREAVLLEQAGIDAVIAQGSEAGGHQGNFNSTSPALIGGMALIPRIADAVSVPVIAAGGIMDARGIVASFALGANGVQMGTAFLGCQETQLAATWLTELELAEGEDTVITEAFSGKPARGLKNRYITETDAIDEPLLPYSAQYSISSDLRKQAIQQGNKDFMVMWSGQGVGLFKQQTTASLMQSLVSGSQKLLQNMASS
jgi:nitronate monooxygenase